MASDSEDITLLMISLRSPSRFAGTFDGAGPGAGADAFAASPVSRGHGIVTGFGFAGARCTWFGLAGLGMSIFSKGLHGGSGRAASHLVAPLTGLTMALLAGTRAFSFAVVPGHFASTAQLTRRLWMLGLADGAGSSDLHFCRGGLGGLGNSSVSDKGRARLRMPLDGTGALDTGAGARALGRATARAWGSGGAAAVATGCVGDGAAVAIAKPLGLAGAAGFVGHATALFDEAACFERATGTCADLAAVCAAELLGCMGGGGKARGPNNDLAHDGEGVLASGFVTMEGSGALVLGGGGGEALRGTCCGGEVFGGKAAGGGEVFGSTGAGGGRRSFGWPLAFHGRGCSWLAPVSVLLATSGSGLLGFLGHLLTSHTFSLDHGWLGGAG